MAVPWSVWVWVGGIQIVVIFLLMWSQWSMMVFRIESVVEAIQNVCVHLGVPIGLTMLKSSQIQQQSKARLQN